MHGNFQSNIGRTYVAPVCPVLPNVDEVLLNAIAKLEDEVKELKLANEALAARLDEIEAQ
jgi:hypothetical protein